MLKSRILRWALLGAGVAVVLLAIAAAIAYVRFDPQSLAPEVVAQIEQATGRKATIGRLSLKLLPVPAVSIAPVAVAGAGGASGDLLRIEEVSIRVRPWPLLRGRLEIGAMVIDRPKLTIARSRAGRWSFADILERVTAAQQQPADAGGGAGAGGGFTVGVERATVRGGFIEIADEAVVPGRRSEISVGPVDATVSGWGMGGATSLDLSAALGKSVLRATARLTGDGAARTLDLEVPPSSVDVAGVATLFPWLGVAPPEDLALAGTVTIQGAADMPLDRVAAARFRGTATMDGVSYRDATMKRPLEKIGGTVTVTGDRAQVEGFTAVLGDSDLRGGLAVENFLKPRITFELESNRLDLNQILETFAGGGEPPGDGEPGAAPAGEGLLNFRARGSLAVQALRYQNFDLRDVRGRVGLNRAVLSLEDLSGSLYGGKLRGNGRADLSGAIPRHKFDVALEGVEVNGAASAYDPGLKDVLRGALTGTLGVEAEGLEMTPLLDTARGSAQIEIAKGALTSIGLLKQIARLLEAAGGKGIGEDETPFESLRGSFAIEDGKAATTDLTLNSTDLDITGAGTVALDGALDLKAAASFSADATAGMVETTPKLASLVDSRGRLTLHLTATGGLAAPSIRLDLAAQTREARDKLKDEAEQKVKDKLRDKLKGLFGK